MPHSFSASFVALYTSAWIEIIVNSLSTTNVSVALYTSAWIEIRSSAMRLIRQTESHSTRVRGLKFEGADIDAQWAKVALYTSAWIEIGLVVRE